MSGDLGWPTPGGNSLNLTAGHDFAWSFQLRDPAGSPVNFPAGEAFLQFPTVDGASFGVTGPASGSLWRWTVYGSTATITVPAAVVDLIPDGAPWYFVWRPVALPRFDAAAAGVAGNGTPIWPHTISGNAVVAFCNILAATPGTVTATCDGVAMTKLASVTDYYAQDNKVSLYAFGLLNPPTGTVSLAVSISEPHQVSTLSMSYFDVASFAPAVTAAGRGPTRMQVLLAGNALVAQAFSGYTGGLINYNQAQRGYWQFSNGVNVTMVAGDAPIQAVDHQPALEFSAGNTTWPAYNAWGGIAVPMTPPTVPSQAGYALSSGLVTVI